MNPTVNIFGVYFPAWLVSSVVALVFSYSVVRLLGSRAATRAVGQSGLFFCSLTIASAIALWWTLFADFATGAR